MRGLVFRLNASFIESLSPVDARVQERGTKVAYLAERLPRFISPLVGLMEVFFQRRGITLRKSNALFENIFGKQHRTLSQTRSEVFTFESSGATASRFMWVEREET